MLKFKVITVPIYNYKIEFVSGDPYEVIEYIQSVYNVEVEFDEYWSACCWYIKGRSIIWFEEGTVTIPIINHEIGHAIFGMMDKVGLDLKDQEVFCYSQEYVLEEILKCIQFTQTGHINHLSTQEDMQ